MTSATPKQAKGRIKAFDSLRGMAALGVVFWHYGAHFHAYPFRSWLQPFYNAGYLLVDFFFVLSGYVIAKAYWREGRQRKLVPNIWSRISRLYPLHLLTLVAVAIIQWALTAAGRVGFLSAHDDAYHFILNLFMLNGVGLQQGFSFNGPAWSISTEFVVNALFMTFIAFSLFQRLIYLGVAISLVVFLFISSGVFLQDGKVLGYLDPQLIRCAVGFSIGVFLQIGFRQEWVRRRVPPSVFNDVLAGVSLIAITVFLCKQTSHAPVQSYFVIMALSAALLITVLHSNIARTIFEARPLVFLGDISYSIYLIHFPLQLLFMLSTAATGAQIEYNNPLVALLYIGMVIYLSHLTHRRVELPSQAFLNSITSIKTAPSAASS